ncbi:MAG: hypothetical protein AAB489_04005 [Patescibacteria group bacterium]
MEILGAAAAAVTLIVGISAIIGGTLKAFKSFRSRKSRSVQPSTDQETQECKIALAPAIHYETITVMNGGDLQGGFANFQIRFGSETDLELIDAALFHASKTIRCKPRDAKLDGGKNWNSFLFASSELPFVPDEILSLKIRVCDNSGRCCEMAHELQMKQFPHTEYTGIKSGRWEIHPKGIFKVRCSEHKTF